MQIEDPLKMAQLEVTDLSSARYALKIANDYYFAVEAVRAQLDKELKRSNAENGKLLANLALLYTDKEERKEIEKNPELFYTYVKPGRMYHGEFTGAPEYVFEAAAEIFSQYEVEKERADAEYNEEKQTLDKMRLYLENLVAEWFKVEAKNKAHWLGHGNSFTWGGCTVTYSAGNVYFFYQEMSYD